MSNKIEKLTAGLVTPTCKKEFTNANGKEWAFIILIMSQYITPLGGGITGILVIITVTVSICVAALFIWTYFGDKASNLFSDPVKGPRIFKICGTLLSLLWVAFLLRGPAV